MPLRRRARPGPTVRGGRTYRLPGRVPARRVRLGNRGARRAGTATAIGRRPHERSEVDWVKLHTRYYTDDRIEALPDADTELMFVRGLARAGELARGGFLPEDSLPRLARRRRYAASVSALLASGLWTRVDGGYRITNWDHWQDALDALAGRRAADRERKRRQRASAREQTPESTVSRDIGHLSRDLSRDVTAPEEEEDLEGVQVGDRTHPPRARGNPPPKCPQHIDDPDPPPCGPCADARRAHAAWEAERAARIAAAPRCREHRGQLAHNCAMCRSERIAAPSEQETTDG